MRRLLSLIVIAFAGLALFGMAGAVQDARVVRYLVPLPELTETLRIVQLSDTHGSRIDMPPARLARVVAQINALHPDIVLLTGDYISGYPDSWTTAEARTVLQPFDGLRARLGSFAVLGNHDGAAMTRAGLAGTRVRLLQSTRLDVGPIHIVGADDITGDGRPVEKMRALVRAIPPGQAVVVVSHEPEFFQWLPPRAAMLIAGHTHGGQIKLPIIGARPISPYLDKRLRGLFYERGQALVVSSGLGTSLMPARIGVPPEIALITLTPGYSAGRKSGTER